MSTPKKPTGKLRRPHSPNPNPTISRSHQPLSTRRTGAPGWAEGGGVPDEGGATGVGGGPKTAEGKAVSARNATTHGLFCRQTVLPHLGEDPDGYKKVLDTLTEQFDPRTLMERQYLELWAEASWKLRRLSRWEAQLWEQDGLDEDARLGKLERVMRLQTTLRRQLDKAVRMLSRDIPEVQTHYARRAVLATRHLTEADCREDAALAYDVEEAVQDEILSAPGLLSLDRTRLDTAVKSGIDTPSSPTTHKNCQNEPPSPGDGENCQNELPPCETNPPQATSPSPASALADPEGRRGVPEGRGEGLPSLSALRAACAGWGGEPDEGRLGDVSRRCGV